AEHKTRAARQTKRLGNGRTGNSLGTGAAKLQEAGLQMNLRSPEKPDPAAFGSELPILSNSSPVSATVSGAMRKPACSRVHSEGPERRRARWRGAREPKATRRVRCNRFSRRKESREKESRTTGRSCRQELEIAAPRPAFSGASPKPPA